MAFQSDWLFAFLAEKEGENSCAWQAPVRQQSTGQPDLRTRRHGVRTTAAADAIANRHSQHTSLLELKCLESGQIPIRLRPLDMISVLKTAIRQIHPLADQKGVDLILHAPNTLPPVAADLDLTLRVLVSLVDNATKLTPRNGQVWITLEEGTKDITVSVADSGPGIPADYWNHLFERFSQKSNLYNGQAHTGLDLAFCKLAIEAQHGHMWAERRPGFGMQFKFTLPL
jgi:signal transduction histidine kinase